MNKKVIIILALVAACAAGLIFFLSRQPPVGHFARLLPEGTVAAINLTRLSTLADTFAASPLGHLLGKQTMAEMLKELGVDEQAIGEYGEFCDALMQLTSNPAFRAVFGEDSTLALLPPDQAALAATPDAALRDSLVLVAQTRAAGALDLLAKLIRAENIGRETVDGLDLTRMTLDQGQTLYGYAADKAVLIALAPTAIRTCLNAEKSGAGLAGGERFKQAMAFWQTAPRESVYSRVLVNGPALAGLLAATGPEGREAGAMLAGVDSMVSLTYATARGMENRGRAGYRYDQLDPMVRDAVDTAGDAVNGTLHLVSDTTLAYSWASSPRPEALLKILGARQDRGRQAEEGSRKNLGVTPDELARAFGPQYGMVWDDVVKAAFFPVPRITLFLQVRERTTAETVLARLRERIGQSGLAQEIREEVAGKPFFSWPVLPDEQVQPAAALTGAMFYLSVGRQPLRELLAFQGKATAMAAPVAQELGPELSERLTGANHGSLVIYPRRMEARAGQILDWLANLLRASRQVSIVRLNQELLQLLQSTDILAASSSLDREQAEWSLTLRLAGPAPGADGKP